MSTHSVEFHLRVNAQDYDKKIRAFVPYYDEMLETAVSILKKSAKADAKIVDLGAGTGGLSSAILRALPDVTVQLLDVDTVMLDQARHRLEAHTDRITFKQCSFFDPLPQCDVFVASLSLHHIHNLDQKTQVYRSVHESLNKGGIFLILDALIPSDTKLSKLALEHWAEKMGDYEIPLTEAKDHLKSWEKEDKYFSVEQELSALKEAGFKHPECFWHRTPVGIYGGIR